MCDIIAEDHVRFAYEIAIFVKAWVSAYIAVGKKNNLLSRNISYV